MSSPGNGSLNGTAISSGVNETFSIGDPPLGDRFDLSAIDSARVSIGFVITSHLLVDEADAARLGSSRPDHPESLGERLSTGLLDNLTSAFQDQTFSR